MNDDYLWDKSGHDAEIEAIEDLLAPLAHKQDFGPPPRMPAGPAWGSLFAVLATAAAVFFTVRWTMTEESSRPLTIPHTVPAPLTAAREIDLGVYGSVNAHEGALVEVLRQSDEEIRLRLTRGTIDARISGAARPRLFQVETPSAVCVDLGCHYTLTVEEDGSALVSVDFGQVAFVDRGRETWVPSGASCRAWPARGSGTPRWDDSRDEIIAAIDALDRAAPDARRESAAALIRECRTPLEALSLWHVVHDSDPSISEPAWAALIDLVGEPKGIPDPRAGEAAERWKLRLEWKWTMGARGQE
jgi:hypothetical protein